MKFFLSRHFLVMDINFINVQLLQLQIIIKNLNLVKDNILRAQRKEVDLVKEISSVQYKSTIMAANYDWVKLESPEDYKFFAVIVAEKLRNNNFQAKWRESFLKTLLEQLKPACTFKAYERIEKFLNEVANQKHQEEKEQQQRAKKESNVKEKKLATLKVEKVKKNYYIDQDEPSFSDDDDEQF